MKNSGFILFFSIVLLLYSLINFYLLHRGWQAFSDTGVYRQWLLFFSLLLTLAYPLGRIAETYFRGRITDTLVYIGSFYLGFMIYAFFLLLLIDLVRLGNHLFHFFPAILTRHPLKSARFTGVAVLGLTLFIVIAGHINALHPRLRTLKISLAKPAGNLTKLNIVMVSDIHLGTIIRNSRLMKIIDAINRLQPDVVLLPGDVMDEDVAPVAEQNMAESFRRIKSGYGVYAVTGNHEYFGGVRQAISYMKEGNITVLQDSAVKVANAFYLIGRKDRMALRMGEGRKSLKDLLVEVDQQLPLILMDHQPFHLEEAQAAGIDLQLSGHTHHGQLFPFNLITKKVYELSWGYLQKAGTHYYVSCGVGTWGPPLRIGNRPEIVQIELRFLPPQTE